LIEENKERTKGIYEKMDMHDKFLYLTGNSDMEMIMEIFVIELEFLSKKIKSRINTESD
jgi:hypothetical protein